MTARDPAIATRPNPSPNTVAKGPDIGPPRMSPAELTLLERLMANGTSRYMEFGAGGSTLLAIKHNIPLVVSIESDLRSAQAVSSHPSVAPRVSNGSAIIIHADIGPTKEWGMPVSVDSARLWPAYIRLAWAEWDRLGALPDLVLVDGRFRVAVCLSIVLACSLTGDGSADPTVVIHDVVPSRNSYRKIFEFFDSVEAVESLRVLRMKKFESRLAALTALLDSQFDPS
jgi:hypothetical protein